MGLAVAELSQQQREAVAVVVDAMVRMEARHHLGTHEIAAILGAAAGHFIGTRFDRARQALAIATLKSNAERAAERAEGEGSNG